MNILLAGYGNIGRAFASIFQKHQTSASDRLILCDLQNGMNFFDYLREHHQEIDLIVNLTAEMTEKCLDVIRQYEIDYIDAALEPDDLNASGETESPEEYYADYQKMMAIRTNARVMFGFGMNPGIIEHLYMKHRPAGRHVAIEFEYDSAVDRQGRLFNTWSPLSYFMESYRFAKLLSTQKHPVADLTADLEGHLPVRLSVDGAPHEYLLIPHEEMYSILRHNPDCEAFAFLYQAPLAFQQYLQEHGSELTPEQVGRYPVLQDLTGKDSVGILFYDYSDNLYYVRNQAKHEDCFREYGCNATCWQTACGVYVAYRLIRNLAPGEVVTMADISKRFGREIDAVLEELHFEVTRNDFAVNADEFRRNVMSWLTPWIS